MADRVRGKAKLRARGGKPKRFAREKGKYQKAFRKSEPKWKVELREIEGVTSRYSDLNGEDVSKFADFPLSKRTHNGLRGAGYSIPTEIQREAIPLILNGKDVLGAAKTGSGKTLAFLIPMLELLWRERWTTMDGIGSLVISPTRELAYQTFEVLRKVGQHHDFSAGLVIGGKDVKEEQERIQRTNIVVCTPGRLLQHMDETSNFDCSSLRMLVLDEADRILDLGFKQTMNAIIENLPPERQTLLFSATQTKSVHDLARLSLTNPEYVAVHEHSKTSTPHKLIQSYIVCELPEKLNLLYSFLKSHLSCKTIIFMSSCKQVKYVYEAFRRLHPGVPLRSLYGRQKQLKRMGVYNDFCKRKAAVLFCTDIAARGLDFPAVHWVVQLDCPEDANTYIHRVGRTARYEKDGKALLFLLPSEEEGMLEALQAKKIPITQIRVNPKKIVSVQRKLESFCAQDLEMKHWAQRNFICYLRSVHLQSNKKIFDVHQLPTAEYANSIGLAQPPRIRFLRRAEKRGRGPKTTPVEDEDESVDASDEEHEDQHDPSKAGFHSTSSSEDSEGEILKVKRVIQPGDWETNTDLDDVMFEASKSSSGKRHLTKAALVKKALHKKIKMNTHIKFDDDEGGTVEGTASPVSGESDTEPSTPKSIEPIPTKTQSDSIEQAGGISIKEARSVMKSRDRADRRRERERIKSKHQEKKQKSRRQRQEIMDYQAGRAMLASPEPEGKEELEVDLPDSEAEYDSQFAADEVAAPPTKRPRTTKEKKARVKIDTGPSELTQDEQLALHLLYS